ncbi:phosphotransferase enzyme family protein [Ophiostoma piceae UAMH 11346]|uniref:Phosphotransferase enzyme family protein n=1 Tax=Ophiostoma piceae (strain UAMH 11346) TaxID=1262450 RepID=S3BXB8_OPHP1|nr:phosphotransferase enzyme family protein [Ophiostoma piceae UAMH 11346]
MTATIKTRSGRYTLESALETEASFLVSVDDTKSLTALLAALWDKRDAIAATAKSHLGLGWRDDCRVMPMDAWVCGGFNTCVLVEVHRGSKAIGSSQSHASTPLSISQYVFRVCMPHKLAESQYPGTIDEKMRCEVAAYAWIEEHCAEIRTPELIGFGFTSGPRFTHVRYLPWYTRWFHFIRKGIRSMLDRPLLTNYKRCHAVVNSTPTSKHNHLGLGYVLLEHIGSDTGLPLSATWKQQQIRQQQREPASNHQHLRRHNLYRSISRIMLSLARLPQQRIGSFSFNPVDCTVSLDNRPLVCATVQLEATGAQRTIPPSQTYERADVYVADVLTLHDNHFMANPHAVRDTKDARERLAMRTLWRTVSHRFASRGPLQENIPQLDLAVGNLVVDDDWNVTCLMGLDWMAVLPVSALAVPHWLTGCKLHQIRGEQYDAYDSARRAFLEVMRQQQQSADNAVEIARALEDSWQSRAVWFWASLRSTSAWVFLFEDHILPFFAPGTKVSQLVKVASFWDADIDAVVETKLADEEQYQAELRQLFEHEGKDV